MTPFTDCNSSKARLQEKGKQVRKALHKNLEALLRGCDDSHQCSETLQTRQKGDSVKKDGKRKTRQKCHETRQMEGKSKQQKRGDQQQDRQREKQPRKTQQGMAQNSYETQHYSSEAHSHGVRETGHSTRGEGMRHSGQDSCDPPPVSPFTTIVSHFTTVAMFSCHLKKEIQHN